MAKLSIKMLTSIAGTEHAYAPGDAVDVGKDEAFDADEAARLVDAGLAEWVNAPKAPAKKAPKADK